MNNLFAALAVAATVGAAAAAPFTVPTAHAGPDCAAAGTPSQVQLCQDCAAGAQSPFCAGVAPPAQPVLGPPQPDPIPPQDAGCQSPLIIGRHDLNC
jgi:hypothetical protein